MPLTVTNAVDDEYEIEHRLKFIGTTFAYSQELDLVFNHQTCETDKLLLPSADIGKETDTLLALLSEKRVTICLNTLGMFDQYVDTWSELADCDDEDWILEGTIDDVRAGQIKLVTGEAEDEEMQWIPWKYIDTIEAVAGSEPMETFEEE